MLVAKGTLLHSIVGLLLLLDLFLLLIPIVVPLVVFRILTHCLVCSLLSLLVKDFSIDNPIFLLGGL